MCVMIDVIQKIFHWSVHNLALSGKIDVAVTAGNSSSVLSEIAVLNVELRSCNFTTFLYVAINNDVVLKRNSKNHSPLRIGLFEQWM